MTYQQERQESLLKKFMVIATALNATAAETDINTFNAINKKRNKLYHAMKVDPAALPVEATRQLLRKYLRLHVDRRQVGDRSGGCPPRH